MQLVTVGSKYQIVIPREVRRKIGGIIPGSRVGISADKNKITVSLKAQDWVERTRGIMTKAWKGVDPAIEIDKMRDEWEAKVKGTEDELKKV